MTLLEHARLMAQRRRPLGHELLAELLALIEQLERRIDELERRIDELDREIEELRAPPSKIAGR